MHNIVLNIDGMSCQHCADSVSKTLGAVAGVKEAQVDWAAGRAVVQCDADQTTAAVLVAALEEAGFDAAAG